jgi:hypothetical protein
MAVQKSTVCAERCGPLGNEVPHRQRYVFHMEEKTVNSVPRNTRSGLEACITAFLAAHPALADESNRISHTSGTEDLWLTPSQAAQFAELAQRKGYLSSLDAQRLITGARQAAHTIHNQAQYPDGRDS